MPSPSHLAMEEEWGVIPTVPRTRQRIYVAGPISSGDLQHNIDQAREAGQRLLAAGFAPLVPHLTCFLGGNTPTVDGADSDGRNGFCHDVWLASSLAWVMMADGVLRLPGESRGADAEVALAAELSIPLYHSVDEVVKRPPPRGHDGFLKLVRYLENLHKRKGADYGTSADILANVRASEQIGIPAWKGAWLRAKDKVMRIDNYCLKGTLANEGVVDSLIDLAAYSLIAALLLQEA